MKRFVTIPIVAAILSLTLFPACSKWDDCMSSMDRHQWAPYTYQALDRLMKTTCASSSFCRATPRPYAVFDFDNTTLINDIEEATLVFQIEHLLYQVTPSRLEEVLLTGIPDVNQYFAEGYENAAGERLTTAQVVTDIVADYTQICAHLGRSYAAEGWRSELALAAWDATLRTVRESEAFLDFRAKLRFLYDAVNGTFDSSIGYPWVLYQFTGFTRAEVEAIAVASMTYWVDYGTFTKVSWTSPAARPGVAGQITATYKTGLALPPEMVGLYKSLQTHGIDVYICSASLKEVVQAVASSPQFGLGIPKDHVFAMMLQSEQVGDRDQITNAYDSRYFMTYAAGKVQTIETFIAPNHGGAGPVLVAGDSAGDYEMITAFPDMRLGLIVNRVRKDAIRQPSLEAAATIGSPSARYVLQGRDENTGTFRASEKSVLLGKSTEELVSH